MIDDGRYLTATALAQALRERGLTAGEALEATIERIEERDGALNAAVSVTPPHLALLSESA